MNHAPKVPIDSPRSSKRLLAYGLTWVAAAVAFALLAPFIGMGNVFIVIFLYLLAVALLAAQGLCLIRRSLGLQVAVVLATVVLVYGMFAAEVSTMSWYLHRFPPPRPMFHNHFVQHERTLLPFWYRPMPGCDRYGHWLWADYEDNVLVVVATGVPECARFGAIASGQDATRFRVGDDANDQHVTIERTENTLIVILPDGEVGRFALPRGVARTFHERVSRIGSENLLREARHLLDAPDEQECDAFLGPYSEPAPTDSQPTTGGVMLN